MNYFSVLEIEPTTDLREIKRAYTRLIKIHSPETNPEDFQRIREAYEKALASIHGEGSTGQDSTDPAAHFMNRFKEHYHAYHMRLNVESWRALLDSDVCHQIDTRDTISNEILRFLTDHYYLPYEVWVLLNEHFAWVKKKEKLYNDFGKNFIDYVVGRISRSNFFRYDELLHCENGQQDQFITHYFDGMNAIDNYDYYAALTALNAAKVISPDHPDLIILHARYSMANGQLEHAYELLTKLILRDDQDYYAYYYRASLLYRMGRYEEAYQDYMKIVPLRPDMVDVLFSIGKCGVSIGKYEIAIEYLNKLKQILQNDHEVIRLTDTAYRFRIEQLQTLLINRVEDVDLAFQLATAYLETNQGEEGYALLCDLEQRKPSAKLYDLMIQALVRIGKKELALIILNKALAQYLDDYDLNHWKADMLDECGELEQAIEYYDKAIQSKPSAAVTYNNKAYSLNRMDRFEEALNCAEKAIALDPNMPNGYKNKAAALLGLERYEECYEACEEALNLHQYYTEVYLVKMQLLTTVRQYEDAIIVFDRAADLGLQDSRLLYRKAEALRINGDYEAATKDCESALELDENNTDALYCKGLCHYFMEQYEAALDCFDKVIAYNNSEHALYYKALCYLFTARPDEVLSLSKQAIEYNVSQKDRFYDLLGDVYREQNKKDEALDAYKKAIEWNSTNASYYYQVGILLKDEFTSDECLPYLERAIELDTAMTRAHEAKISALFHIGKDYKQCLNLCDIVLEMEPDNLDVLDFKAWSFYMLDQHDKAAEMVQEGLKLDGNYFSLLHLKWVMLKDEGRVKEALVVCDRILELDPDHEETFAWQAELMKKSKWKWLFSFSR